MTVEELFGRVAVTYVQTTRLKVSAPVPIQVSNTRLRGPASRATGCRRLGRPLSIMEGEDGWEAIRAARLVGPGGRYDGNDAGSRELIVPVQTVRFVPMFVFGTFFLIVPGMIVTLFFNNDPLGFAVCMATAVGALVRPTASWILFTVLCSLRTVPFIIAALTAVAMRIGLASEGLPYLIAYLFMGGIAHLRIRALRRSGAIEI